MLAKHIYIGIQILIGTRQNFHTGPCMCTRKMAKKRMPVLACKIQQFIFLALTNRHVNTINT